MVILHLLKNIVHRTVFRKNKIWGFAEMRISDGLSKNFEVINLVETEAMKTHLCGTKKLYKA